MSNITYQNSICFFIDVLGFTNLVRYDRRKIEAYFGVLTRIKKAYNPDLGLYKFLAISDSIVLSIEYDLENRDESLKNFRSVLELVSWIQGELANIGIWTRGGVAAGDLSFDMKENILVGSAFIKAMEVEKTAKSPRVVIDNDLVGIFNFPSIRIMIEEMNKLRGSIADESLGDVLFDFQRCNLSGGHDLVKDRPMFIDYANVMKYPNLTRRFDFFEHLKSDISKKLEFFEKYQWLTEYYAIKAEDLFNETQEQSLMDLANKLRALY